jgi:Spy/CpxP family protein refolding chaperone
MLNRRVLVLVLAGLISGAAAESLSAQAPRAEALRRELEIRFAEQMREQLQLSDEQAPRVRDIMAGYAEKRRTLEMEERRLRQALNGQLRPGIAANPDSVTLLVDGISAARVNYAKLIQDEMRELSGVLTPVQRGQLFLMRERLLQRVREMRDARQGQGLPPR